MFTPTAPLSGEGLFFIILAVISRVKGTGSPCIVWPQPPKKETQGKERNDFLCSLPPFSCVLLTIPRSGRNSSSRKEHCGKSMSSGVRRPGFNTLLLPLGAPRGSTSALGAPVSFQTGPVTSTQCRCKDLVRKQCLVQSGALFFFVLATVVVPTICVWFTDDKTVFQSSCSHSC